MLLSELVRRTLRGGVAKIEEEMHDFVEEKVSSAVESRMPEFQEAATKTAETKARDIARQEVVSVEELAKAEAQRLANEIAETERRSEDKARTITKEAVEVVASETRSTAEKLVSDLAETERRAEEKARELVAQHVEELKQKSKSTYVQVRESLDELTSRAASLESRVVQEQHAREAAVAELMQAFDVRLQQRWQAMQELCTQLQARNSQLELRLRELEKPRGLRALWAKMFGRKKTTPPNAALPTEMVEEV